MLHQSQTPLPISSGDVLALNKARIVRNTLPRCHVSDHYQADYRTGNNRTMASPFEARYSRGILSRQPHPHPPMGCSYLDNVA
jgi:hypothetical protein